MMGGTKSFDASCNRRSHHTFTSRNFKNGLVEWFILPVISLAHKDADTLPCSGGYTFCMYMHDHPSLLSLLDKHTQQIRTSHSSHQLPFNVDHGQEFALHRHHLLYRFLNSSDF